MAGKNYFEMIRDGILVDGSGGGDAPAPVLITKSVTANGTYSASDDSADGYSTVSVSVPNTYGAGDEGKVVSNGALVSQTSDTATQNGEYDTTLIDSLTVDVEGGEATLTTKSITVNGTYAASGDNADGYSSVTVAVENSYTAQDEGKVVSSGALVAQTAVEKTVNGTYDTTTNNSVVVNVANSYVAADEGKVVSNGALVAQGSDSVTENGTVDTTLISSLLVNVQGGTGTAVKLTSTDTALSNIDLYIVDTGLYIYLYGSVKSSGATERIFDVPTAFDLSTIASQLKGVRSISGSTGNSNINASIDTTNKRISLQAMNNTNYYFFVFSKT